MLKALVLLAIVFILMIYPFSLLAVYAEVLLAGGNLTPSDAQGWRILLWPFPLIQGKGISWGLALGAGLAAVAAQFFYHAFIVRRWGLVSEEQYQQLMGRGKS